MKPIFVIQGISPYRAVSTVHFGYKNQYISVVKGKNCSFYCSYMTHTDKKSQEY